MSHRRQQSLQRNRGFSLLEMVVAVAILGISLTALYQAAGGATRTVGIDEKLAYGVELARSLVATNAVVPSEGMQKSGATDGGFGWEVIAQPLSFDDSDALLEGQLQELNVVVRWPDGDKEREFKLHTVVAGKAGDR